MKAVFLDTETSGLSIFKHEIIEIGAVQLDLESGEITELMNQKVMPRRPVTSRAAEVNGYTPEAWEGAVELREALDELTPIIEGGMLGGHNVGFDLAFIRQGYEDSGLPLPRWDHRRIDTMTLGFPLLLSGDVTSLSLDSLCRFLGIDRPLPHRAAADANAAAEVAYQLSTMFVEGVRSAR